MQQNLNKTSCGVWRQSVICRRCRTNRSWKCREKKKRTMLSGTRLWLPFFGGLFISPYSGIGPVFFSSFICIWQCAYLIFIRCASYRCSSALLVLGMLLALYVSTSIYGARLGVHGVPRLCALILWLAAFSISYVCQSRKPTPNLLVP